MIGIATPPSKTSLATTYRDDRMAYTDAKTEFVERIVEKSTLPNANAQRPTHRRRGHVWSGEPADGGARRGVKTWAPGASTEQAAFFYETRSSERM